MEILPDNQVHSSEGIAPNQTQKSAPKDGPAENTVKFDDVLAQAHTENSMQQKPPVAPHSSEAKVPSPSSAPSVYIFAQGPGYGSGTTLNSPGTPGYGGDTSPSQDSFHSAEGTDTGAKQYSFAQGPGYGSGTTLNSPGTPGYGGDTSPGPDDLFSSIRGADRAISKYAIAKGSGYGSGLGTAGYGSDSSPDDIGSSLSTTQSNKSPGDSKTSESDH